jgi:D-3-phosphoglycerate dehydrogenase
MLKYQESNINLLHKYFNVIVRETPDHNTADDLKDANVVFAPLGYMFDRDRIKSCSKLKIIASNTTGIPHIDHNSAIEYGVKICALNDEQDFLDNVTPTAEHTIGLIISALRRIPAAHKYCCEGNWNRRPWGSPKMMSRMSLGVIGYGRLGRKVGSIAQAMGMMVDYYDPYVPGGTTELCDLALKSDIISLHAVSNDETKNLVDREILSKLPQGAVVVNTARGELLDTDALIDLLEEGKLWAAALDTIDGEYDKDFPIKFKKSRLIEYANNNNNLILTPHIAGSTVDAWYETERRVIEKVCSELGILIK